MKSAPHSKATALVEIGNVSKHGFWVLLDGQELFLPFSDIPWFQDVAIARLMNVKLHHPHHLYWPDLDVDLSLESIRNPERFPLTSRVHSVTQRKPSSRARIVHSGARPAKNARRR